ncbi:MAG TPA: helix-turn-helix transcriptional regulator [Candidatus Aquicultor sp.]|jgi:transcriptional regulator with XRE-family HTH domain
MSIGSRIRTRREGLGFTQKELAARVDVTDQLISLWELDRRSPSAEKLADLSNTLGVTTDYLIKGEEAGVACNLELAIRSSDDLTTDARDTLLRVVSLFMRVRD